MPDYILQPEADYNVNPGNFSNAVYAGGIADPGDATGLIGGTSYIPRELSPAGAAFTPLAAASFSVAYAAGGTVAAPAADPSVAVVNVGAANANLRLVIVGHALLSGNITNKLAALTVNGGACTVHVQSGGLGSVNPISFIAMTNDTVPAGGDVTISADWTDAAISGPNSTVAVRFEVFRVISSGAPTIAFTNAANNAALSLNVQTGDAIIAALTNPGSGNADPSGSWSNATHNSSVNLNGNGLWSSVASVPSVAADATGLAVSNTVSGRYAGLVLRAPA